MGSMTGIELATNLDLPLEKAIGYHLQGNHYPPVPLSMVKPCIEALDAALKKDGDELLSEEEKGNISEARELLVNAKASDDSENIKAAIKKLENACADYVARRMNSNIRNAMQGHSVEEYAGKDQE